MPPLLSESEAESGSEEVIPPKKTGTKHTSDKKASAEPVEKDIEPEDVEDDEEDDDDDDEEEEEEVYQVEKIVAHDSDFPDKQVRYQVKWLGYDKEEDHTWEVEENLEGAREILQAYFNKIGGRPVANESGPHKKRGRKSSGKADTPDTMSNKKAKIEEPLPKKKDGRGRKRKSSPGVPELSRIRDGWEPPKPVPGAWEEGVLAVQTIEGNDDGTKWAYLMWADEDTEGKKRQTKALLSTCYIACPQIMLKFFEAHLVFTDKTETRKKTNGT